jgi:copper oxidase (laccase) domain-containing protein
MAFRAFLNWTNSTIRNFRHSTPTVISQRKKTHLSAQRSGHQYHSSTPTYKNKFPRWSTLALLGVVGGTAYAHQKQPLQERLKKLTALCEAVTQTRPDNKNILSIPGLRQSTRITHGVTTAEAGNIGFVTLKDGVTPAELTENVQHVLSEINHFSAHARHKTPSAEPFLIVNETAYANANAPGLAKTADGKPVFIVTLTAENIGDFMAKNQFAANSPFAALRDKCVSVICDGFVSNISHYQGKQLYFAASTADAAPVILFDETTGILGVMPCPWHAVCKRELDTLIEKMRELGAKPEYIQMGIGPGLGPESYEFSKSDAAYFYQPGVIDKRDGTPFQGRPSLKNFIHAHHTDPNKCLLDMPGMLKTIAIEQGLQAQHIHNSDWNSMKDERFFSARRTTPSIKRPEEAQKQYPKTSRELAFVNFFSKKPSLATARERHVDSVEKKRMQTLAPG